MCGTSSLSEHSDTQTHTRVTAVSDTQTHTHVTAVSDTQTHTRVTAVSNTPVTYANDMLMAVTAVYVLSYIMMIKLLQLQCIF